MLKQVSLVGILCLKFDACFFAARLNDGVVTMLVTPEKALKNYNFTPKARTVPSAVVGVEPKIMDIGPDYATKKAFQKQG